MRTKKQKQILAALVFLFFAGIVIAAPEGPTTLAVGNSSTRTPQSADTLDAYAGNVSTLNIFGKTVTQTWQAYAGNISGTVSLEDSEGYVVYDWELASPEGEIYATYMSSVDWSAANVQCWNWTHGTAGTPPSDNDYLQLEELEGYDINILPNTYLGSGVDLGLAADDVDGVNETFNYTPSPEGTKWYSHSSFYVGTQLINGSCSDRKLERENACGTHSGGMGPCPVLKTYNGTRHEVFEEVLLYANESGDGGIIYTAIIKDDVTGYNNKTWDFQMLVGEDGHDGDTTTTTYYFYVELE